MSPWTPVADNPVRLGVIGCGMITRQKHMRVLSGLSSIEVVALADGDPDVLDAVSTEYGVEARYRDLDGLLAHPGLEAVAVVVPAAAHASVAVAALEAGMDVLVEKPLAATLEDGRRILAAAQRSSAQALMGFHTRFHRLIQEAAGVVASGRIGEIESVRTLWCSPASPEQRGPVSRDEMRPRHGESALIDLATPAFDLWRLFTGEEVEALWAQRLDGYRSEEVATINARLTNDVLATGTFSVRTTHEIEVEVAGSAGRLRVGAERFDGLELLPLGTTPGSARLRLGRLAGLPGRLAEGWISHRRGGVYLESFHRQWAHFAQVVRGDEPSCTVEDGIRALAITLAARESAGTGAVAEPAGPAVLTAP